MLNYIYSGLGAWTWVVVGLLVMGLELVVPGAFMIWLGLAAVATGIAAALFDLGW